MNQIEKIAIIGIGCLFPGAENTAQFWQNLAAGAHTTSPATAEQLGVEAEVFFDGSRRKPDTSYFLRGGYIHDFAFDADGYALPPEYLSQLSSAFKWSLTVAREALHDSGYGQNAATKQRTGVILGNLAFPTTASNGVFHDIYRAIMEHSLGDLLDKSLRLPEYPLKNGALLDNTLSPGFPAAVVAHALALGGGYFALDAACASSLYAVGLACKYLSTGKADLMLAGAVSAADPLFVNLGFAHLGGYPTEGQFSRPLDSTSGGLIAGEGAGMFALKRLADAQRDGDTIYAVVSGVGMTNDGRGKHILTPNPKGQVRALQRAYDSAGLLPGTVQYVECHASGTTVGDRTELNSMEIFFSDRSPYAGAYHGSQLPRIGSVKSNVGHLLTAAGMASMIKVILSMHHSKIPATLGIQQPLESPKGTFSGAQITAGETPWRDDHKRAGVNAFGFGGVSAHLIMEHGERYDMQHSASSQNTPPVKMAIVGMDAHFGPLDGLDAFAHALYDATPALIDLPESRWKGLHKQPDLLKRFGLENGAPQGAYIDAFDLDFMYYRIPPADDDVPIPQQLLLLKVADRAIRDADLPEGANIAVIVALGTELALHQLRGRADLNWQIQAALDDANVRLDAEQTAELERISKDAILSSQQVNHYTSYIGNITANRVSSLWDFNGPSFTVSAEENSTFKALELAQLMLTDGEADAVVVGAVDLAGGIENVLLRSGRAPLHEGKPVAGFDAQSGGWMVGEGAGAVVLTREENATADRVYATIDAVSIGQDVAAVAQDALKNAGAAPTDIGYLELHASGIDSEDQREIEGITATYRGGDGAMTTAVGSVKAITGHTFNASGMASLIKTALALSQRFIPAVPNWSAPELPDSWQNTPLWVATKSRTWFGDGRKAAISGVAADGSAAHVVLSGVTERAQVNGYLRDGVPQLFPLSGDNESALMSTLDQFAQAVGDGVDLNTVADAAYNQYNPSARYTLALVGKNHADLLKEIERARSGVPAAFLNGTDWTTPAGSAFAAAPVGKDGKIAFVYPGAFNSYPKLGYDLIHLFPQIYDDLKAVKSDVGEAVAEHLLYPRTLEKPGPKVTRQMKEAMNSDPVAMIESGLSFALLYTRIMRDVFNIQPSAAFGYSLGEGSMMWGMGVWREGDAGSAGLHSSTMFVDRLTGPMNTVREAWGIDPDVPDDEVWAAHFIAASAERVKAAASREARVYVTHINTPNEVMIAGEPNACQRVVDAVGGESMRAPFSVVIHNEAMMSEFGEYFRLHDLPVTPVDDGVTFYSAADYTPIKIDQRVIATSIARMACKQIDFPRLIDRAYADGARVFIELGPRSTCARWVDETLGTQPHLVVSIDTLGADDRTSLIKLLAQLVAHSVPLNLSALYRSATQPTSGKQLIRTVRLGGQDIYDAIVNEENREKFGTAAQQQSTAVPVQPSRPVTTTASQAPVSDPTSAAHITFLESRRDGLRQLGEMVRMQMESGIPAATMPAAPAPQVETAPAAPQLPPIPAPNPAPPPSQVKGITPMYDQHAIETFSKGRVADCFGENYAVYDDRRAPRIPNGDLLLVQRALEINGERYQSVPGTNIIAEYDVPVDEWYYRDNAYPVMPYSVYMEIALQPCGFLSAYHGPTLATPEIDFYFRNLDGYGKLYHDLDMRGRTITNHVTMLGSTVMQGIIIQKFSFVMFDGDLKFYEGEATFGYFTKEALNSQAGLDVGKEIPRWIDTVDLAPSQVITINPKAEVGEGYLRLSHGQLEFTSEIKVVPGGGKHGEGYAYANTIMDPDDWFFACHFYQDPVMPGSIGVETVMQALQAYAIETGLADDFTAPRFAQVDGKLAGADQHTITWKYRGQILTTSDKSHVEANIKRIDKQPGQTVIYADASLWRDKLRIYEVKDIALAIVEA